ncbi:RDD family protein [Salarchaeum sp. III]|uniref:RDD family protein n=1 Tax=Salarchaeum sp. III TaxID=3107927 RepID=UPI002ED910C6
MDFRLFGAIHIDRPGAVADDLDALAADADALFLEHAPEPVAVRTLLRLVVRAPLAAVGLAVTALVQLLFLLPLVRDVRPVEQVAAYRLADEHDIPVHGVDSLAAALADWGGSWWVLANWVCLAVLALADPFAGALTTAVALGVVVGQAGYARLYRRSRPLGTAAAFVLFAAAITVLAVTNALSVPVVVGGVLASSVLVRFTIPTRDAGMADRAVDIAEREGYERACLIAGAAHVSGVTRELAARGCTPSRVRTPRVFRHGTTTADVTVPDATESVDPSARDVFPRRALAALLDLAGAAVAAMLAAVSIALIYPETYSDVAVGGLILLAIVVVGFCYYAVPEALTGRTLGKRLTGLVVVSIDGSPISTREAVVRNLARPVDVVGVYALGFVVAWVMDGQRLGDISADTVVVESP